MVRSSIDHQPLHEREIETDRDKEVVRYLVIEAYVARTLRRSPRPGDTQIRSVQFFLKVFGVDTPRHFKKCSGHSQSQNTLETLARHIGGVK